VTPALDDTLQRARILGALRLGFPLTIRRLALMLGTDEGRTRKKVLEMARQGDIVRAGSERFAHCGAVAWLWTLPAAEFIPAAKNLCDGA
jgi:hypothetical protein